MLFTVVDDCIWIEHYPVKLGPLKLQSTMTIVRLTNGSLWIHSPAPVSEELLSNIKSLGEVSAIVASNAFHHLNLRAFATAFPSARCYISSGLRAKGYEESRFIPIQVNAFQTDFDGISIEGLPVLSETVWFHRNSKTLIATDTLIYFGKGGSWGNRLLARIYGAHNKLAFPRTLNWFMVKDRAAFTNSFLKMVALSPERIIPCHQQPIDDNVGDRLSAVLMGLI